MKTNQLAALVLRLMGVYCLVVSLPMAHMVNTVIFWAKSLSDGSGTVVVIFTLLLTIAFLAVGVSLIVFSRPLADKLTPKVDGEGNITSISFEQTQALAFAVAGILIFAEALPELVNVVFGLIDYLIQLKRDNPYRNDSLPWNRFGIIPSVGTVLKAALGFWLFFGAHGLANFWRSMRNFGTPKPPTE